MHRIPDQGTIHAARAICAELPCGKLSLEGVSTPLPDLITTMLREILVGFAGANSISLAVLYDGEGRDPQFHRALYGPLLEDHK